MKWKQYQLWLMWLILLIALIMSKWETLFSTLSTYYERERREQVSAKFKEYQQIGRYEDLERGVSWVKIDVDGSQDLSHTSGVNTHGVKSFWITEERIPVQLYRACVKEGSCSRPKLNHKCVWDKPDQYDHAVNCIDHDQAQRFTQWMNCHLATQVHLKQASQTIQTQLNADLYHSGFRCVSPSLELVVSTDQIIKTVNLALMQKERRAWQLKLDQCRRKGRCIDRLRGLTWIRVQSGSFSMGAAPSVQESDDDERPVYRADVNEFWITESEVTTTQYQKCVEASVCKPPRSGAQCNWKHPQREYHPINCINWRQARAFSQWVGGDLPTEIEWEYAARGGQTFRYSGSNDSNVVSWHGELYSSGSTHAVKQKLPNDYGLYDMSGNVWEWNLNRYTEDYSAHNLNQNQEIRSNLSLEESLRRSVRGGSWLSNEEDVRVTNRQGYHVYYSDVYVGFRPIGRVLEYIMPLGH